MFCKFQANMNYTVMLTLHRKIRVGKKGLIIERWYPHHQSKKLNGIEM